MPWPRKRATYSGSSDYILFHGKRHPRELGAAEVEQFLTDLAVRGHVSASTQNQALNALVFLYTQVLGMELGRVDAVRARRPKRLPVVLAPEEVQRVLARIQGAGGVFLLMAQLLYGCGLRLMECCRLRVKDVSLERGQVVGARRQRRQGPGGDAAQGGEGRAGQAAGMAAATARARRCSGAWGASTCRTPWSGSTPVRPGSWAGSSCSPRGSCRLRWRRDSARGFIATRSATRRHRSSNLAPNSAWDVASWVRKPLHCRGNTYFSGSGLATPWSSTYSSFNTV